MGRDSKIYEQRPLPLASKQDCVFLPVAAAALDAADIHWECPYQANDWRDLVAFVSAGLAIETNMPYMARIKDWDEVPGCLPCRISGSSCMSARVPRRWRCNLPGSSAMSISIRQRCRRARDTRY